MKIVETLLTVSTAVLAATSLVAAVIFGAWWHVITGAMFATLSGAMYNESKSYPI